MISFIEGSEINYDFFLSKINTIPEMKTPGNQFLRKYRFVNLLPFLLQRKKGCTRAKYCEQNQRCRIE